MIIFRFDLSFQKYQKSFFVSLFITMQKNNSFQIVHLKENERDRTQKKEKKK